MENKITRVLPDFLEEIQKIDPRLMIVENPNRPKIANIKLDGEDVCPIPRYEIKEYTDPGYTIEMPNGMQIPHKSKIEALASIQKTLTLISTPDGADAFFRRNGY